jgi:hypothetical protein
MRGLSKAVLTLAAAVLLLPSLAFAQGTLTGTVRDQSGAVLPGVTVEAASPALIEKVRTAVTDSAGQYRITGLNPGIYSLTFTITGFNVVKREGIELGGTATLTVPIEMRVGALEETITVTVRRRSSTCRPHSARRCSTPTWWRPSRGTGRSGPC